MTSRAAPLFSMLALFLAGCGLPTLQHVRRGFITQNPTYSVLLVTNRVDGHFAYYHIIYHKPDDETFGTTGMHQRPGQALKWKPSNNKLKTRRLTDSRVKFHRPTSAARAACRDSNTPPNSHA